MGSLWRDCVARTSIRSQPLPKVPTPALGMWEYDAATDRCIWEPATYELHGVDPGLPVDFDLWASTLHHMDRDHAVSLCRHHLAQEPVLAFSYRTATGRYLATHGKIRRNRSGEAVSAVGVSIDMTDLARAYSAAVEVAEMLGADDPDPDDSQRLVRLIRGTLGGLLGEKIAFRLRMPLRSM